MANLEGVAKKVLSARTLVELNAEDRETGQRIQVLGVGMKFASIEHARLAVQLEGVAAQGCASGSRRMSVCSWSRDVCVRDTK